jgi:hypothetical protein
MIFCGSIHGAGGDGLYLATLGGNALDIGNFISEFVGPSGSRSVRRACCVRTESETRPVLHWNRTSE